MAKPENLQFKNGKFEALVTSPSLRGKFFRDPYWTHADSDVFTTTNLGAARGYRVSADESAERVFRRAFQSHYVKLPRLPKIFAALDRHQQAGILWILTRKRSYLAHAPGAGKTAQAIVASLMAQTQEGEQTLFIVPPTLTLNWEREIWKFTAWLAKGKYFPTIGIVPRSDRRDEMAWRADFIICPDSMLSRPWVYTRLLKMKKRFVAVDEASRFKDPQAERTIALFGGRSGDRTYPGLIANVRHVVLMDGSPMPNRPMELWAPTFALHPEAIDCMDQNDFGYRYCGARPNQFGQWEFLHSSHEEELRGKLRQDFMHVVTEDELSHPERQRSMLFMDRDVRSLEQKTWERKHLPSTIKSVSEVLSQGEMAHYRRELGVRKVPWIARYVADRLRDKNESILLFAWHRDVVDALMKKLSAFKPACVYGGITPAIREKWFREFQAGKLKLIIGNIAAMGRGHNLQRADRVIFGEWSWTDETNKQCEKRASRRGNDKAFVRCEYIVCPNSMDEPVLNSVFTKEKRVERIIG